MPDIRFPNMYRVDLEKGPAIKQLHQMFMGDKAANRIGAYLFQGDAAVSPGGNCSGTAILNDGSTVALTGTVAGNEVYIDLPPGCYAIPGPIQVYVLWTNGTVMTTVVAGFGTVTRTETGTVIDPGTIIPSVAQLIQEIEDAVDSIPEDYSSLNAEVAGIRSDLDEAIEDFAVPTQEAVDNWLNAHPDATTTVQDGSLTEVKFSDSLKLLAIKDYLTPMMFSGYHGDGTTDDTAAMTACVAACGTQRKMLYIPKGKTVYIAQKTLFENQYLTEMLCYGTIKAPNGIEFRRSSSQTGGHWFFSNVDGELILSGIKNFLITIEKATKLTIFADSSITSAGSCAYNQFKLGHVATLLIDSLDTGWINENVFWGGRIKNLTISGNGSYPHNHNHFYNPTLEDGAALVVNKGFYNYFHNVRAEEGSANTFTFGASAYWNFIERTYVERPIGPGESGGFTGINDISHRNFYTTPGLPFFRIYERTCDWQSNNYNALFAHPEGKNLRIVTSASSAIINTKIIPIDRSLFIRMRCSETAFRYLIYAYDANQNPITTKPSVSPIIDALGSLSWSNDHYGISADRNSDRLEICRYVNGVDTGVCYVMISMYFPTGKNMLINVADMRILCNRFLSPPQAIHFFKEERLTASNTPGTGDWKNGDIVWNTGTTVKCAGWFYQNSGWHPFGEYS